MGQKVNPVGLRIGIHENWRSRWYSNKEYSELLEEDISIRRYITDKLSNAYISKIEIERTGDAVTVDIHTARPGIVIGRKGKDVDSLKSDLEKITTKQVQINIQEVTRPELDATLVATNIAEQLAARIAFRRAMKRAISSALKAGAKGIKVSCSGRLGGAEMARTEWYREGRVPLHTLQAKIDYGFVEAHTTMGRIGVKVWIYKGNAKEEEKAQLREDSTLTVTSPKDKAKKIEETAIPEKVKDKEEGKKVEKEKVEKEKLATKEETVKQKEVKEKGKEKDDQAEEGKEKKLGAKKKTTKKTKTDRKKTKKSEKKTVKAEEKGITDKPKKKKTKKTEAKETKSKPKDSKETKTAEEPKKEKIKPEQKDKNQKTLGKTGESENKDSSLDKKVNQEESEIDNNDGEREE